MRQQILWAKPLGRHKTAGWRCLGCKIVGNIRPVLRHCRRLPAWHSTDNASAIVRRSCPSPWAWSNGSGRRAGDSATPWRAGGDGQTTARAGGSATSRREREGGYGLVVSRGRHSDRGFGVVPCAGQREVGEDAVKTAGSSMTSKGGELFLAPASAARSLAAAWGHRPTRCASSALGQGRTPPST